jgi:hypothetical protein
VRPRVKAADAASRPVGACACTGTVVGSGACAASPSKYASTSGGSAVKRIRTTRARTVGAATTFA